MLKAILWDIDGVIIRHNDYFSNQLERENYYQPREIINEFRCTSLNTACDAAKSDVLAEIKPFLDRIGWTGSCSEYFLRQYEYEERYLDFALIDEIQKIRERGIQCFIASNQNYFRKAHLVEKMKIYSNFDGAFFSCDIKAVKTENSYWECLLAELNKREIKPAEMLFLDDMLVNIEQADKFGIRGVLIGDRADILKCLADQGVLLINQNCNCLET